MKRLRKEIRQNFRKNRKELNARKINKNILKAEEALTDLRMLVQKRSIENQIKNANRFNADK